MVDSVKSRLGLPGAISVRECLRLPRGFGARRGRGNLAGKSPLTRGLNRGMGDNASDVALHRSRATNPFISSRADLRQSRSRSRSRVVPRSRSRSRARSQSNHRLRSRSKSQPRYGVGYLLMVGTFFLFTSVAVFCKKKNEF